MFSPASSGRVRIFTTASRALLACREHMPDRPDNKRSFDRADAATATATDVDGDGDRLADARAYLRRFGRLAAQVAERHGGHVDTIFDLPRVLRLPGTYNRKPDSVTGLPGAVEIGQPPRPRLGPGERSASAHAAANPQPINGTWRCF